MHHAPHEALEELQEMTGCAEKSFWLHCNALPHTATHCDTLQRTTTHCNELQRTAIYCNTLQRTAGGCDQLLTGYELRSSCGVKMVTFSCSALQCVAVCSSALQLLTEKFLWCPCNALQRIATHCNALSHTATHSNATLCMGG